ncbi:hypothetical protein MANES_11G098550v8 [Manihot esculenta]|uniref:Uncharacterized protein n=1 Tax=Manihot esculenta TaxID=3983 RepID=A0ACB7GUW6_MANES|nr:hypothetical protein MANES_11G098550v8 [Manihot esculenta]
MICLNPTWSRPGIGRMKQQADKRRSEKEFQEGDWVYLKLQLYRQTSLALRKNLKLAAKYYGPYQVLKRVGKVAYQLQLPENTSIHHVFHVSLLKRKLGDIVVPQTQLLTMVEEEVLVAPAAVLKTRTFERDGQFVNQNLIQWTNLTAEEAMWEDRAFIQAQFPEFQHPWGQECLNGGSIVTN